MANGLPRRTAAQRRVPYEARADSVMYARCSPNWPAARGWAVHLYEAKDAEARRRPLLGPRADEVLHGPRAALGPPWTKDHRIALAATVMAG